MNAPFPAEVDELTLLLRELVAVESYSGKEQAVQSWIYQWLEQQGLHPTIEPAEQGLGNIVCTVEGQPGGPTLWLGGHCDTVGIATNWTRGPHDPVVEGSKFYGLGALDMKGGLAAAMLTARNLHRCRDKWAGWLILAALADEEAYSRGAKAFVAQGRAIDAAIMCEPHFDDIVIGALGKFNIAVEVTGRSAHGSRPREGVNAVNEAARLLVAIDALERYTHPRYGRANHCVLNVSSGDRPYEIRVPDRCTFAINWHVMPGETAAATLATLNTLADGLNSQAHFSFALNEPSYESFDLTEDHPLVVSFGQTCREILGQVPVLAFGRGVSDANIFVGHAGIPTLLFGPGGGNMHSGDEWVDLDQLHAAQRVYQAFALRYLTTKTERIAS